MARKRKWTPTKRRRARKKANAALRQRKRTIEANRHRVQTSYTGMVAVAEYANQMLRLPKRLPKALAMKKGKNAVYQPLDEAMAHLGSQITGIARLNNLDQLLSEQVVADLLGLPQWPSHDTEQRFLRRATQQSLEGMDPLTQRVILEPELQWGNGLIEVDGDVTGIPQRARKREGVQPGFCGGKVRPCYQHPRVTVNGLSWWSDLRAGDDGCMDVFDWTRETALKLAQKSPKQEVNYRLDADFISKEHLEEALDPRRPKNLHFLLAVHASKMKEGRWEELVGQAPGRWIRINSTTEVRELGPVRPWEDVAPIRAVAVRRQKRDSKGKKRGKGRSRVWDLRYLILTDIARKQLGTRKTFKRYHQRQGEEYSFKDGKQSLPMGKIPTQELMANRMHVKMVALAQVIVQMFARYFLPHPGRYGPTCKRVRETVIAVGGENLPGPNGRTGANLSWLPLAASPSGEGTR